MRKVTMPLPSTTAKMLSDAVSTGKRVSISEENFYVRGLRRSHAQNDQVFYEVELEPAGLFSQAELDYLEDAKKSIQAKHGHVFKPLRSRQEVEADLDRMAQAHALECNPNKSIVKMPPSEHYAQAENIKAANFALGQRLPDTLDPLQGFDIHVMGVEAGVTAVELDMSKGELRVVVGVTPAMAASGFKISTGDVTLAYDLGSTDLGVSEFSGPHKKDLVPFATVTLTQFGLELKQLTAQAGRNTVSAVFVGKVVAFKPISKS